MSRTEKRIDNRRSRRLSFRTDTAFFLALALVAALAAGGLFESHPPSLLSLAFTAHPTRSPRRRPAGDNGVAKTETETPTTRAMRATTMAGDETSFENIAAAVIVPGFLTGDEHFSELCDALTARGIPAVATPMPSWHWIPCLGGRSSRPILERIDHTVRHLVANLEEEETDETDGDNVLRAIRGIPPYRYSLRDCWHDFRDNPGGALKVGGSSEVDDYPIVEPRGDFPRPERLRTEPDGTKKKKKKKKKKIALIGHSAGGWISRIYLSASDYGGRAYGGSENVHTLVTLGTPHTDAPGPAFDGIRWINRPENEADRLSGSIRSLSVAGTGFRACDDWGHMTAAGYEFCCPEGGGEGDGDGVTPVFSALGMPGSESRIIDSVTHFCWSDVFGGDLVAPELTEDHRKGRDWYGSPRVVDEWASFILEATTTTTTTADDDDSTTTAVPADLATRAAADIDVANLSTRAVNLTAVAV